MNRHNKKHAHHLKRYIAAKPPAPKAAKPKNSELHEYNAIGGETWEDDAHDPNQNGEVVEYDRAEEEEEETAYATNADELAQEEEDDRGHGGGRGSGKNRDFARKQQRPGFTGHEEAYTGRKTERMADENTAIFNSAYHIVSDTLHVSVNKTFCVLAFKVHFSRRLMNHGKSYNVDVDPYEAAVFLMSEFREGRLSNVNGRCFWSKTAIAERRAASEAGRRAKPDYVAKPTRHRLKHDREPEPHIEAPAQFAKPQRGKKVPPTRGGGPAFNQALFDSMLAHVNEHARKSRARVDQNPPGGVLQRVYLTEQHRAAYSTVIMVMCGEWNNRDEVIIEHDGFRIVVGASKSFSPDPNVNAHPIVSVRVPPTRGGSDVQACQKKPCRGPHYHTRPKEKRAALSGGERRMSEKVKLAKVCDLVRCEEDNCLALNPDKPHFHISRAQKVTTIDDNRDDLQGAIDDTEEEWSKVGARGKAKPTIGGVAKRAEVTEEAGCERILQRNFGTTKRATDWVTLDGLGDHHLLTPMGDGGFRLWKDRTTIAQHYTIGYASGENNQCWYTAIMEDYDEGQKLKRRIMSDADLPTTYRTRYVGKFSRGGDELAPWVASILGRSIIVLTPDNVRYYPCGTCKFEDAIHVWYDPSGDGHYSPASTDAGGDMYKYLRKQADKTPAPPTPVPPTPASGSPPPAPADDASDSERPSGIPPDYDSDNDSATTPSPSKGSPPISPAPTTVEEEEKPFVEKMTLATPAVHPITFSGDVLVPIGRYVRVQHSSGRSTWYVEEDGVYRAYDPTIQTVGDTVLPSGHRIVDAGTTLERHSRRAYGHYAQGRETYTAAAPGYIIPNFVVSARAHDWFAALRVSAMNGANTATLGWAYNRDTLHRGLTKKHRDVIVVHEVMSYLMRHKSFMTIGVAQRRNLFTPVFEQFLSVPIDLLIDTAVVFAEMATSIQSQMKATTASCEEYLRTESSFVRRWVPPTGASLLKDGLRGLPAGVYPLIKPGEAEAGWKDGYTVIHREPYGASDPSHGSALDPNESYLASKRFKCLKTTGGAKFIAPYIYFPTRGAAAKEKYQSVGGCFATAVVVVERSTIEKERSMLRVTCARKDEERYREAQRNAFAYAYRVRALYNNDAQAELTRVIRARNPLYVEPPIRETPEPTPLQMILDIFHRAYEESEHKRNDREPGDTAKHLMRYVIDSGIKVARRIADISDWAGETNQKYRRLDSAEHSDKPDEYQKVKKGKVKFSRAVISLVGFHWVQSDPVMWKELKGEWEQVFTVVDSVASLADRVYPLKFTMRDFWYRAVLSDTSHDALGKVLDAMEEFVSLHPGAMAAITHGDDQLAVEKEGWTEGDIVSNDSSHVPESFRVTFLGLISRGYEPFDCFAQCAMPLVTRNTAAYGESVTIVDLEGENLKSGWAGTTGENTPMSAASILGCAIRSDGDFIAGAADVGFEVEVPHMRADLTQVTFLSRCFYRTPNGIRCFTEVASLLRGLGRYCGDIPGKSTTPIKRRWEDYVTGTVKSWVHEPDCMWISEMRRLVLGKRVGVVLPNDVDNAIVHRYFPKDPSSGLETYLDFVRTLRDLDSFWGAYIVHPFVDAVMAKRYGLDPVAR